MANKTLLERARDFWRWRSRGARGFLRHRVVRRLVPADWGAGPHQLHIGSGMERLEGWINIDLQALPEVDLMLDVTRGLPFEGVRAIYAEHFLEHLSIDDGLRFLRSARRALGPEGHLRLSTPNLDWVWSRVYSPGSEGEEKILRGLHANRSFYGWQHRFLWNRELLGQALEACGFGNLTWHRHGQSELPLFVDIERHEVYPDDEQTPHVLIVEARPAAERPEQLAELRRLVEAEFLRFDKP